MDSVQKRFIKYVSLNIFGMIGLSCYILADTFFVAKGIGADGLAALNIALPIYNVVNGIGLMLGMGGATRFAILKGEGQTEHAGGIFTQTLYAVFLCSIVFLLVDGFFSSQIATWMGANGEIYDMTLIYLQVVLAFSPAFLLNNVLNCFVRNDGNPNLAMAAMLFGSLGNIVLDYLFIFPLQMGMLGAVLATGMAPLMGILLLSTHFIRHKSTFKIKKQRPVIMDMLRNARLGIASLITELSSGTVILIFNILILGISGNMGVAAYGVIANIALVVLAIFTGVAHGIQPIISDHFGRGESQAVNRVYRYALCLCIALAVGIYVFSFWQADAMVALFNSDGDPQLQQIANEGIKIYFVGFLFAGINLITAMYFSAIGTTKPSFLIAILRGFVVMIPAAVLLSSFAQMVGIWLAFPITEAIVCVVGQLIRRASLKEQAAHWSVV